MAPATAKEWTRGSFYLHCGVALCGDQQCTAKSRTRLRGKLFRNSWILAHLRSDGNDEGGGGRVAGYEVVRIRDTARSTASKVAAMYSLGDQVFIRSPAVVRNFAR
jgi:hypothetical protein